MNAVRKLLKEYGIRPSKRLGQSFLEDGNVMDKIVRAADVRETDVVVEIGAGLGVMTEMLAARAKKVVAVDVDPRMTEVLRSRLKGLFNVTVVEKDILSYDLTALGDGAALKLKIVGNVPYNISTPILFHLINFRKIISSMILLLQKEVVDRLTASPGTKDYGIPSVILAMYAVAAREMDVPARCFYPQPRVESSLMKAVMRKAPLVNLAEDEFFFKVVRTAFAKRRKTLFNNLRSAGLSDSTGEELKRLLEGINIDGSRRGETLSVEEFGLMSNALFRLSR